MCDLRKKGSSLSIQSTLSKTDTLGPALSVRLREMSVL